MTKRQYGKYKRNERDFHPTPQAAVRPLLPHLKPNTIFEEPCAGDGRLINWLEAAGHICHYSCDIEPKRADIAKFNALKIKKTKAELFITNFPWSWVLLQPLLDHLPDIAPTWTILDADIAHNKRMAPYIAHCVKIVSVGRVSWLNNGKGGFDNAAWYLFNQKYNGPTEFFGRI